MNATTNATRPDRPSPVYVLGGDGRLHRDPRVAGPGWRLLFLPRGQVLLVLTGPRPSPPGRPEARQVLRQAGIDAEVLSAVVADPPGRTWSFVVRPRGPLPSRLLRGGCPRAPLP